MEGISKLADELAFKLSMLEGKPAGTRGLDPAFVSDLKRLLVLLPADSHHAAGTAAGAGSSAGAGPSALTGGLSTEALRKELKKTNDAYTGLIRDSRAAKTAWEQKERGYEAELHKLRTQMSHMDRLRRDHNESLQAIKSLREKLEAATSAQTLLRQRLDERTKAKDTASSTVQGLQNEIILLKDQLLRVSAASAETAASQSALQHATARIQDMEAQLQQVREERDALLDFVQDQQKDKEDLKQRLTILQDSASAAGSSAAQLADARGVIDSQRRQITTLESRVRALEGEVVGSARQTAALEGRMTAVQELEAVQKELLRTIKEQADEVLSLRKALSALQTLLAETEERKESESRRSARLQRMVDAYSRLEKEFSKRTGQGFLGLTGLSYEMHMAALEEAARERGRKEERRRREAATAGGRVPAGRHSEGSGSEEGEDSSGSASDDSTRSSDGSDSEVPSERGRTERMRTREAHGRHTSKSSQGPLQRSASASAAASAAAAAPSEHARSKEPRKTKAADISTSSLYHQLAAEEERQRRREAGVAAGGESEAAEGRRHRGKERSSSRSRHPHPQSTGPATAAGAAVLESIEGAGMEAYLHKLRTQVTQELQQQQEEQLQQARRAAQKEVLQLQRQLAEAEEHFKQQAAVEEQLRSAVSKLQALESDFGILCRRFEGEVRGGSSTAAGASITHAADARAGRGKRVGMTDTGPALAPAAVEELLREVQQRATVPSLQELAPSLSKCLLHLSYQLSSVLRQRQLADGEVSDLREELAQLRSVAESQGQENKAGRQQLQEALSTTKAQVEDLLDQLQQSRSVGQQLQAELSACNDRIGRYKERVLRAKHIITSQEQQLADAAAGQQAIQGELSTIRKELGALEQRWADAKAMNSRALQDITQKDATIARLRMCMHAIKQRLQTAVALEAGQAEGAGGRGTTTTTRPGRGAAAGSADVDMLLQEQAEETEQQYAAAISATLELAEDSLILSPDVRDAEAGSSGAAPGHRHASDTGIAAAAATLTGARASQAGRSVGNSRAATSHHAAKHAHASSIGGGGPEEIVAAALAAVSRKKELGSRAASQPSAANSRPLTAAAPAPAAAPALPRQQQQLAQEPAAAKPAVAPSSRRSSAAGREQEQRQQAQAPAPSSSAAPQPPQASKASLPPPLPSTTLRSTGSPLQGQLDAEDDSEIQALGDLSMASNIESKEDETAGELLLNEQGDCSLELSQTQRRKEEKEAREEEKEEESASQAKPQPKQGAAREQLKRQPQQSLADAITSAGITVSRKQPTASTAGPAAAASAASSRRSSSVGSASRDAAAFGKPLTAADQKGKGRPGATAPSIIAASHSLQQLEQQAAAMHSALHTTLDTSLQSAASTQASGMQRGAPRASSTGSGSAAGATGAASSFSHRGLVARNLQESGSTHSHAGASLAALAGAAAARSGSAPRSSSNSSSGHGRGLSGQPDALFQYVPRSSSSGRSSGRSVSSGSERKR